MNKFTKLVALACLLATNAWATTYYVSTSGSNSNNGTSTGTAWRTLTYAASATANLQPGDLVYVKAGNYGNENVVFARSGTAANPIVIQGYKTTPGDAPPVLVTTATASTTFSTADMPTYIGTSRNSGIAIDARDQKYITFKNIQISNYAYGFLGGGSVATWGNLKLDNVNVMTLGNTSSSYSGKGIQVGDMGTKFSDYNTITNCLVINAGAEAFDINGNNNTLTGCKAFCNENTGNAATDYYILICGSYNAVNSCYVERLAGISHGGHGIGAKTNAEQVVDQGLALPAIAAQYNTFTNCTAKNMGESFYVRHRTAQYNVFKGCKATGTHTGLDASSGEGGGIMIRDGASSNTFNACTSENCSNGITFEDTVEDGDTGGSPTGHPGNYNKILNCIINNCYVGVEFSDYGVQSDAGDNTIANTTFYKTRYLHYAGRHCANMKYIGNIYFGTTDAPHGGYFRGNTYQTDVVVGQFKQCDFIKIEGGMPSGFSGGTTTNIAVDPVFVSSTNLHLQSTSPCIDKVDQITFANNPADFDGNPRYFNGKSEMGAYEYYAGNVYYVNLNGSNSNNGKSETASGANAPWRTLTYAASATPNLQPGDVVYVKAGSYGNENVVFAKSGNSTNPIYFLGYTSIPGDVPPVLVTTATASTTFTSTDMPTYTGTSRNSGIAFDARSQKYINIKNFQIQNYEYGFLAGGTVATWGNLKLENINAKTFGNSGSSYSGKGIQVGDMGTKFSDYNTITNCLVINAGAEAFDINGNNNTLTGCKAFCNETTGSLATDYYILVCGSYNAINSCYAERLAGISHGGHGIGAKTNAEQVVDQGLALPAIAAQYNTFTNCVTKNMGEGFYVRHRTAQYNTFTGCTAYGTHTGLDASSGEGGGITIRDGASSNTFNAISAINCSNGITFEDTVEDGDTGGSPTGHPGNYNKILNCIINNCYVGVEFSDYSIQSDAGDNTIANCTFYKTRYLHYAARHCANMKYIGNIYFGTTDAPHGGYFRGNTYSSDVVVGQFKQCDFIKIEGGMPSGFSGGTTTNIASDPLFVSSTDLHLTSSSPCIDKVDLIILADNPTDFEGTARYNGGKSDMGAYEYHFPRPENTTSIENVVTEGEIRIYPNPSNGMISVASSLDATNYINVVNMIGQSVYKGAYSTQVNLSDLKAGIYFVQFLTHDGQAIATQKISIQ